MRIGIDAACWSNHRGFGRFIRELVPAIIASDPENEYLLFADRQTAEQSAFPDGCRVIAAQTSQAVTQAASSDGRRSVPDMWAMHRLVRQHAPDLMFFPAVYSFFPIPRGIPCVVTFHDVIAETLPHLIFSSRRSRFFWNLKSLMAIRAATYVMTVSQASKRGLIDYFQLPEDRVRVVSEAPGEAFSFDHAPRTLDEQALERHSLRPGERYLLYVGGISPHKNLDTLINAFVRIAHEPGMTDVRLVLVGDYAGDAFRTCYEELKQIVADQNLDQRVHFPGFVPDDDLWHVYKAAQAFVFPSYLEGFGLPAAEAMACGTPVLASDRGSLPEVLNGAGELFDPHDDTSIAHVLARVLTDDAHREDLQRRSLARAKDFSWNQSARQAVAIFRDAVQ